jgi:hypothetical protein
VESKAAQRHACIRNNRDKSQFTAKFNTVFCEYTTRTKTVDPVAMEP